MAAGFPAPMEEGDGRNLHFCLLSLFIARLLSLVKQILLVISIILCYDTLIHVREVAE